MSDAALEHDESCNLALTDGNLVQVPRLHTKHMEEDDELQDEQSRRMMAIASSKGSNSSQDRHQST